MTHHHSPHGPAALAALLACAACVGLAALGHTGPDPDAMTDAPTAFIQPGCGTDCPPTDRFDPRNAATAAPAPAPTSAATAPAAPTPPTATTEHAKRSAAAKKAAATRKAKKAGSATSSPGTIMEDQPGWNCATDGNRTCG
jgi:hypothetical protein